MATQLLAKHQPRIIADIQATNRNHRKSISFNVFVSRLPTGHKLRYFTEVPKWFCEMVALDFHIPHNTRFTLNAAFNLRPVNPIILNLLSDSHHIHKTGNDNIIDIWTDGHSLRIVSNPQWVQQPLSLKEIAQLSSTLSPVSHCN